MSRETYYKLVARREDADFEAYGGDEKGYLFPVAHDKPDNWISVDDRLPEDNQSVIATRKFTNEHWFGCCIYRGYFPWVTCEDANPITPWMPLPAPPENKS